MGGKLGPVAWVHDRIFAAGGSHIPATWDSFRKQTGISAVLTLSEGKPAVFQGKPPEHFLWLDIVEEGEATPVDRELAGRFLFECVESGRLVLLHSIHSRHRTRWAYVSFLMYEGASLRAALRQAAEAPWLSPYTTNKRTWQEFDQMLRPTSSGPAA